MRPFAAVLFVLIVAFLGCSSGKDEVVVYAALDREFSEPILNDFTSETGISVVAEYDIESTKSVGKPKVDSAKERLLEINPAVNIVTYNEMLTKDNIMKILKSV